MTLGDLKFAIEHAIAQHGEDILELEAYAVCDYGDRCHTQQLINLGDNIDIITPYETAYSESGLAIRHDRDDEIDDINSEPEKEKVVVIR